MVVREADDAGAQAQVAGALGGGSHEYFRGGDGFPAGAVVLTNPGFIKTQVIQPLEQFEVALQGQGRVFADPVERGHEYAEFHTRRDGHRVPPLVVNCSGVLRHSNTGRMARNLTLTPRP